jgi:WD40 repeat protein
MQIVNIIKEEEIVKKYSGHQNTKNLVDLTFFTKDEQEVYILSGSEDGSICMWNTQEEGKCIKNQVLENSTVINAISVNKNGLISYNGYTDTDETNSIYFEKINL